MKTNAAILHEMSWTGTAGDPVAFLSRVAELAQGSRLRVLAVGPLEQQDTPQFSKSWHAVTVQGPFQDLVDLATRVESDRGTLENVTMEAQAPPAPVAVTGLQAAPVRATPEVLARFRVTALQLTQQARRIIDDAAKASGVALAPPGPQAGLSLPVPSAATESRDPFSFGPSVERPRREVESAVPRPAFDLQGIVGFPGGHLAILNNQIVRAGDKIGGHTVEHITDTVVLAASAGRNSPPSLAPRDRRVPQREAGDPRPANRLSRDRRLRRPRAGRRRREMERPRRARRRPEVRPRPEAPPRVEANPRVEGGKVTYACFDTSRDGGCRGFAAAVDLVRVLPDPARPSGSDHPEPTQPRLLRAPAHGAGQPGPAGGERRRTRSACSPRATRSTWS